MKTCRLVLHAATALVIFMLAPMTEASAANLILFLVNNGATTHIFNDSVTADGNCEQTTVSAELSRSRGTLLRQDAVGDTVGGPNPTELSFTSDVDFIVPAKSAAVTLKLWASSGDGTCPFQNGDQDIQWDVRCNGACGSNVPLTPAKLTLARERTVSPKLYAVRSGPAAAVHVHVGDTLTLRMQSIYWMPFLWSTPSGVGLSSLVIKME